MLLTGKNAMITGSRRGIGRATVEVFAAAGANVWACARKPDSDFEADMAALAEKYAVWIKPVYFDLADENAIKEGVRSIQKEKLPVDILVNNAGILSENRTLLMTSAENLRDVLQVNFIAPILITQIILRVMIRQGRGNIVNMVSVAALASSPGYGAYGSAKAALCQATQTFAAELAPYNIRVNAVAPSVAKTDMSDSLVEEARAGTIANSVLKRAARPEEIAGVIAFLASETASYMTGQIIRVDGGM